MKNSSWILKTEFLQNRFYFLTLATIALSFGVMLSFGVAAYSKIAALTVKVNWDADLVILPKGISLNDLHDELLNGETRAVIPEALFDTTVSLAHGQFALSGVMAVSEDHKIVVYQKGERIGVAWLPESARPWPESATGEAFAKKKINAVFASGTPSQMTALKTLIDDKTVAQALWIRDQTEHAARAQQELFNALSSSTAVFILLFAISAALTIHLVSLRLRDSFRVFAQLGLSQTLETKLLVAIVLLFGAVPLCVGFALARAIFVGFN